MKRTLALLAVLVATLTTAAIADDPANHPPESKVQAKAKPPAGQAAVVTPTPTGYDVAIVGLSSTGPEGNPANALKVTFENKGTMSLYHDLRLEIRANGQTVSFPTVHIMLPPGGRWTWTNPAQAEANLFPWGTEAWAKIDTLNALAEDNETNNTFSHRLEKLSMPKPVQIPRP